MKRRDLLRYALLGSAAVAAPAGILAYKSRIPAGFVSVESFGIVPDGLTNWEETSRWDEMLLASVHTGVYWPPGYYATGINFRSALSGSRMHFEPGSIIGGVFHLISGAVKLSQISSIRRDSGVVHVEFSRKHSFQEGEFVQVRMFDHSSFNHDKLYVTGASENSISLAQDGPDEIGRPRTASSINPTPITNVKITGLLTTTDRFGTINCKDCYVESVWVLNDPGRHSAYPGQPCRGAHIYVGTEGLTVGSITIDYAGGPNTAAAFAVDGHFWNPSNCRFGRVHIKDSAHHGAYITGYGHSFDFIRIDSFAKLAAVSEVLQDSNGIEQNREIKGLWINRCWDTYIKVMRTNQETNGFERFETHHALIDETGNAIFGVRRGTITIDDWYASNVRARGIAIGDNRYDSIYSKLESKVIKVVEGDGGVDSGFNLFSCNAVTIGSAAQVGSMVLYSNTGRKIYVAEKSSLDVGILS